MSELVVEDGFKRQHRQRLNGLLDKTKGTVRIASAYVTDKDLLIDIKNRKIQILTSLFPMDIASGATSLSTLRLLIKVGIECRFLQEHPRLHAKVYIFGSTSAVVTSANLTGNAFNYNIEVGVEVSGRDVQNLTEWFDKLWKKAYVLTLEQLDIWEQQTASLRSDYIKLKKKTNAKISLPPDKANQFFICNTNRRDGRRSQNGYLIELEMKNRSYATAWETFKFPGHMQQVEPGDTIFMFAKRVGIIGIGRAKTRCETLKTNNPDRVGKLLKINQPEWRVPVEWLTWGDDEDAYRWNAPNFTFWNVSDKQYLNLREGIRKHFLSD
jgi:hypothetical protein